MSNVIKVNGTVQRVRVEPGVLPPLESLQAFRELMPPSVAPREAQATYPSAEILRREFERGVAEGRAQAERSVREEVERRLAQERAQSERLLPAIRQELESLQRGWEESVVRFSLAVAERIVKREVMLDNEVVLRQIREGLRKVLGVLSVKIRVHPLDEPLVREHRTSLVSASDSIHEIVVEADESIERGGCILESDNGNVDGRLATQMGRIEAVLFEQHDRSTDERATPHQ